MTAHARLLHQTKSNSKTTPHALTLNYLLIDKIANKNYAPAGMLTQEPHVDLFTLAVRAELKSQNQYLYVVMKYLFSPLSQRAATRDGNFRSRASFARFLYLLCSVILLSVMTTAAKPTTFTKTVRQRHHRAPTRRHRRFLTRRITSKKRAS